LKNRRNSTIFHLESVFSIKTRRKYLLCIFIGALVIRLSVLFLFPNPHLGTNARIAFIGGAQEILYGEGFADPLYPVFIPPLTAVFVAGHFLLFGEHLTAIKITHCILDAATVIAVSASAAAVFGWGVALLTAIALSFYPFTIFTATYIGSEVLYAFLLSLLFFSRSVRYRPIVGAFSFFLDFFSVWRR